MSDRDLTQGAERERCFSQVTIHSLAWLSIGNLVGLLLASLLIAPSLGRGLGALTYGRWVPVHLNLQLYGWCALPLVGLLFQLYLRTEREYRLARWALGAWSGSLLFGALSWLSGHSSGKPFLDWSPTAAAVLAAGMTVVGLVLVASFMRQLRRRPAVSRAGRMTVIVKGVFLVALLALPALIYRVSQPDIYPPYNPRSGGATGGSLLGSTLVVVAIFVVTPLVMRLERRLSRPSHWILLLVLAGHFGWFALLDHGNRSNHEWLQIVSLASLVVWPPLLMWFFRAFRWPAAARRWMTALALWGFALVSTGLLSFLPGVLELEKFTNALVGHAHLAMAGMATSFCMLVLIGLGRNSPLADLLGAPRPFVMWQVGCLLQIVALLVLGGLESADPGLLYQADTASGALYLVRWVGGLAMLVASTEWLVKALRSTLPETLSSAVTTGVSG